MNRFVQGCLMLSVATASLCGAATPVSAKIATPVKGKVYTLSRQHGPWMIMVTTVTGKTTEEFKKAAEGANQIVFELRQKGIPAYIYKSGAIIERVDSIDRQGRSGKKIYAAQRPEIAILAGNYDSADDPVAHKTLEFIKRFRPKALEEHAKALDMVSAQLNTEIAEGTGFKGKSQYGPLYKSFMAPNPMLTPDEIAARRRDPLIRSLNLGHENSIAENKGKFTLVVATFEGKSTIKPARYTELDAVIKSGSLDHAGKQAEVLARTMRAQKNIPAFVYHDKFRSVVTVGSFNSPEDPEIAKAIDMFKAKVKRNDATRQEVLVAESFKVEGRGGEMVWVMDPNPKLIAVPRIK